MNKDTCWICHKKYHDHTSDDWANCALENSKRGETINELERLLGKNKE
jgi:hypothetical protein